MYFPPPPKKTKRDDIISTTKKTQIEEVFPLFFFTQRKNSGWLQLIPLPLQSCSYKNNITMRNRLFSIPYWIFGCLQNRFLWVHFFFFFCVCRGGVLLVCFCNMDIHWRTLFLAGGGVTSQCDGQDPCPLTL